MGPVDKVVVTDGVLEAVTWLEGDEADGIDDTGIIVAPSPIRPSRWMACLWEDNEPVFDDVMQVQSALDAVGLMFNTLSTRIELSLRRLEAERICY